MANILVMLLYVLGIFYIVVGTLMLFVPDMARKKIILKLKNMPIKRVSVIPIIIGLLLLFAASYNRYGALIVLLGLLALTKGIVGIVATEKMEKIRDWFIEKADKKIYRIYGIVMIILGSVILTGI